MLGCGAPEGTVGGAAPDFKVNPFATKGETVNLSDFKGKVVLLDFWATWCGPCREVMPEVQALHEKYQERGLEVMAITQESRDQVIPFARARNTTYPLYLDTFGYANKAFRVTAIPTAVVVGRNGAILETIVGSDPQAIRAAVEKALG